MEEDEEENKEDINNKQLATFNEIDSSNEKLPDI